MFKFSVGLAEKLHPVCCVTATPIPGANVGGLPIAAQAAL